MRLLIAAMAAALLSACATTGPVTAEAVLQAGGFTREAYCALAPEARAEVRRIVGIRVPLLACRGDRRRAQGSAASD